MAIQTRPGAAFPKPAEKAEIKLIDIDVHPTPKAKMRDLFPHMPQAWQKKLAHLADQPVAHAPSGRRVIHPRGRHRENVDAIPPEGGAAASDPQFFITDYIDKYGVDYRCCRDDTPRVRERLRVRVQPDDHRRVAHR